MACKLCRRGNRADIDKYLLAGHSYKEFCAKFPLLKKISISCWSRHRSRHVADTVAGQNPLGLTTMSARTVVRKLMGLASRAEKSGKIVNAIAAYTAAIRAQEVLEQLVAKGQGDKAIEAMSELDVEAQILAHLTNLMAFNREFREKVRAALIEVGEVKIGRISVEQ
jgi:hypothetical protein